MRDLDNIVIVDGGDWCIAFSTSIALLTLYVRLVLK